MQSSVQNLLMKPAPSEAIQVSSAVKTDLKSLVNKHVEYDRLGMGANNRFSERRLTAQVAQDMLLDLTETEDEKWAVKLLAAMLVETDPEERANLAESLSDSARDVQIQCEASQ